MKTIEIKHAPELSEPVAEQLFLFLAELTDAIFTQYHDQILANTPGSDHATESPSPNHNDQLQVPDHIVQWDNMWRDIEDIDELENTI